MAQGLKQSTDCIQATFLSIKCSVCKKFRDYLIDALHFSTYADENTLMYIVSSLQ